MTREYQQIIISLWLPLGINNMSALAERAKLYLEKNREVLRYSSWDHKIELTDLNLSFKLLFNSPYDKYSSYTLCLAVVYYGWGYIKFSLTIDDPGCEEQTLPPNFVNENTKFLLKKVIEVVSGILLEHQCNYLSNILFGNGILNVETYVQAAIENKLDNGIMDGASDEEIRQGFRFEGNSTDIAIRRNRDILVKTLILKRTASSVIPANYDDIDGDFGTFIKPYQGQYLRGRHRTSLLINDNELMENTSEIIDQICSSNSLVRFLRLLLFTMVSAREQLSIVRVALLKRRGIKLDKDIPQIVYKAEQEHLQSYVLYLLSRIPLLDELVQYVSEMEHKVGSWTNLNNGDKLDQSFKYELIQQKEYIKDLIRTATRVLDGLKKETESVGKLIEIHDQEEELVVTNKTNDLLEKIQLIDDKVREFSQMQTTMQKRTLETQYIQSEFARSSENRQRANRAVTQITGAAAISGLLTPVVKNFLVAVISIIGNIQISTNSPIDSWLNTIIPIFFMTLGFYAVRSFLSQTRQFGDALEIVIPLDNNTQHFPFDQSLLLTKRFEDVEHNESEKRLNRLRIEGSMYRVTWQDEIALNIKKPRAKNTQSIKTRVFATLEYTLSGDKAYLTSLIVSAEKSEEYKSMLDLKEKLIELASRRLHYVCKSDSNGDLISLPV